jgi:hypothetical protein
MDKSSLEIKWHMTTKYYYNICYCNHFRLSDCLALSRSCNVLLTVPSNASISISGCFSCNNLGITFWGRKIFLISDFPLPVSIQKILFHIGEHGGFIFPPRISPFLSRIIAEGGSKNSSGLYSCSLTPLVSNPVPLSRTLCRS